MLDYDKDHRIRAQAPDALNFKNEAANIKKAIKDSGRKISFKHRVATREALTDALRDAPTILHISCHGMISEKGKYLILENEFGCGDVISLFEVRELLW